MPVQPPSVVPRRVNEEDLFLVGVNGTLHLIREEYYLDEDRKIPDAIEKNFLDQKNFYGQILTRVVEENLKELKKQSGSGAGTPRQFEPGYLLDLRRLRFANQLRGLERKKAEREDGRRIDRQTALRMLARIIRFFGELIRGPNTKDPQRSELVDVDVLKGLPEKENLYIVAWDRPPSSGGFLRKLRHFLKKEPPASVYYLKRAELANTPTAIEKNDGPSLEKYFRDLNVQVGIITASDMLPLGMRSACYVANINAFEGRKIGVKLQGIEENPHGNGVNEDQLKTYPMPPLQIV